MNNWNTPEGIRLAERMGIVNGAIYCTGLLTNPVDIRTNELLFNDAARQSGEKHGMHIAPIMRGLGSNLTVVGYIVVSCYGYQHGTWKQQHSTHTAACMAMAELALKEEGR